MHLSSSNVSIQMLRKEWQHCFSAAALVLWGMWGTVVVALSVLASFSITLNCWIDLLSLAGGMLRCPGCAGQYQSEDNLIAHMRRWCDGAQPTECAACHASLGGLVEYWKHKCGDANAQRGPRVTGLIKCEWGCHKVSNAVM